MPRASLSEIAPEQASVDRSQWDRRADGSAKGDGFLGVLKRPDGKVSSEISVGVNIDGKEVEIPTLVPTLSAEERQWLLTNDISDPSKLPKSIIQKAVDYARPRLAAGKSAFAQPGESPTGRASLSDIVDETPSLATRAKDVAIGAGKGLVQEVTGIADLIGPVLNGIATRTYGKQAARPNPAAGEEVASISDLAGLHAINPDQQKGKYIEAALSLASPFIASKARALFNAGKTEEAWKVIETAKREMPNLLVKREMPRLIPEAAPVARQMPPLAEASSNVARQMPRLVPDAAQAGRVAGKAPTVQGSIQDALEAARTPEAPSLVSGVPEKTITGAGNPATTATEYDQLVEQAQRRGSAPFEPGAATSAAVAPSVDASLKAGKVEEAATTIEQKVKLTVNQLAEKMRAQYGSARAGKMLQPNQPAKVGAAQLKRLAPGESQLPTFAVEDMAQRGNSLQDVQNAAERVGRKGEKGGINPYAVSAVGGGAVGAAVGGSQGDTTQEHFTNAVIGGTAGAVVVPLLAHAIASGSASSLKNAWFSALLARPGPVIRAYLGGVGGAAAAAHDLALAGKTREAGILMHELFSGGFVDGVVQAAKKSGTSSMMGTGADFGSDAPTLVGRVYNAVNEPAMRAMLKAGVSQEDAMRYTLAGVPRTKGGQVILNAWNQWFPLKAMGSMFPRVGVQVVEHGLERMGVKTAGVNGLNQGVSAGVRAGRALTGAGTALAAYEGADRVPTWAQPYLTALSGVYALPVGIGLAVGKAKGSGGDQITAGLDAVNQYSPFPKYGPTEGAKQIVTGAAFVPGVVADAARAKDPYERQTSRQAAGFFARTKARIPGLRETLPIKGQNVNIAGVPNQDRSSAITRFMSAASSQQDKLQDVPAAVVGELQRLNVPINAPSFDKSIKIGSREIALPPDVAERARAERRQQLLPRVEKLIASPNYQRADDTRKKRMLETAISRAEAVGSQQARAAIVKTLRSQGALRGSR